MTGKKIPTKIKNKELVKEKHKQIIEAVSDLFSEKGYHKTTMRDISQQSGIDLSYLYKYINGKNDILYLYYEHVYNLYHHIYQTAESSKEEDPVVLLKKVLVMVLRLVRDRKREVLTIYSESRHLEKDGLKTVLEKEAEMINIIDNLIRRGVDCGKFKVKEPLMAANIIQYLLTIECLRGWGFTNQYTSDETETSIVDFILAGLGAEQGNT